MWTARLWNSTCFIMNTFDREGWESLYSEVPCLGGKPGVSPRTVRSHVWTEGNRAGARGPCTIRPYVWEGAGRSLHGEVQCSMGNGHIGPSYGETDGQIWLKTLFSSGGKKSLNTTEYRCTQQMCTLCTSKEILHSIVEKFQEKITIWR